MKHFHHILPGAYTEHPQGLSPIHRSNDLHKMILWDRYKMHPHELLMADNLTKCPHEGLDILFRQGR
ncbi:MAG: hypothetical protein GX969_06210 [Firmicutes bacterium]|jgi:hypothetical protein|nr:hypothetical protein [Bacillota bacterium]